MLRPPTELTMTAKILKKAIAPKADIPQKNSEAESLQKSAKTPQKAALAKKGDTPMLLLSKIQPRPTELTVTVKKAKIQKRLLLRRLRSPKRMPRLRTSKKVPRAP